MSIRVSEDIGAGKLNSMQKIGRVESIGPVTVVLANESKIANAVACFKKENGGAFVKTDKDTLHSAESTGYTGNASTLVFSGQALNVLPVVPGTIVTSYGTSGDVLKDLFGDGKLYMPDGVTVAGTINYFTGAIALSYPSGHAPNGLISATYYSQDKALVPGGQKNYGIGSGLPGDAVVCYVAADKASGVEVKMEAAATWM